MKLRIRQILCHSVCWLFIPAGVVLAEETIQGTPDSLPGTPNSLRVIFEEYSNGKISNEGFSHPVDALIDQASNPKQKTELLSDVMDFLSTGAMTRRDIDDLVIRYSTELAGLTEDPDEAATVQIHNAIANENLAAKTSGAERSSRFLLALKSWIEASKIISGNLKHSERQFSPGVNPPNYIGYASDPQFKAVQAEHEREEAVLKAVNEDNDMLGLVKPVKDGMERDKSILMLNQAEFTKIWMQVEARDFNGSASQQ